MHGITSFNLRKKKKHYSIYFLPIPIPRLKETLAKLRKQYGLQIHRCQMYTLNIHYKVNNLIN